MKQFLLLSIRILDDLYHGRTDNNAKPEWPPSPFRAFQAIIAGNAHGLVISSELQEALRWLEQLDPPIIIAPIARKGRPLLTYVLNNVSDDPRKNPRTKKIIRPMLLNDDRLIQYVWGFDALTTGAIKRAHSIAEAVRHINALGWGIDLAIGYGEIVEQLLSVSESRIQYRPAKSSLQGGCDLRVPRHDSLMSLERIYADSLERYSTPEVTKLESAGAIYELQSYVVSNTRPSITFELRSPDSSFFIYTQRKLIHIAGMVRHLAIDAMKASPPLDVSDPAEWVDRYVAGHAQDYQGEHRQLSYLPLPSIGHPHADQAVRRVMIAASVGDDRWLEHLARRLDRQQLKPKIGDEFGFDEKGQPNPPPTLLRVLRVYRDKVAACYTASANTWASVTPVILPGHDDRKPAKRHKLILKALAQSGIEQPCEFESSPISCFRKSLTAHKYKKDADTGMKRWQFADLPPYLRDKTWVHLTLTFKDELKVPGPLVIGAGRHCGLGLMAWH